MGLIMTLELENLEKLTNRLDTASKLYYEGKETEFSDTQFDLEMKNLQELEKKLNWVFPNSPTLRVGSDLKEEFGKIEHPDGYPMLTIDNVYSDDELKKWLDKMLKTYNTTKFNASLKYDGISCELRYDQKYLVSGSTRGDKLVGDDITDNVKTIKSIPLSVPTLDELYVRGEILLPKSQLQIINSEREKNGEKPFSNCRNACSGSVKQLDSKITAQRKLIFRPWDLMVVDSEFISQTSKFAFLTNLGFIIDENTMPITLTYDGDNFESFSQEIQKLWNIAKHQDYDCDGVVIKINDCNIQKTIGTKDHRAIEWGIARKWNEEYYTKTELLDVDWQVGRTGNVTPVGKLDPVECDGVIISNVTLNNIKFIKNFDIHIGNTLRITRSGGVIPYVLGVEHDILMEMHGAYPKVEIPTKCPVCGAELVMDGEILKCTNSTCPAQIEGRIEQWCSKDCMNIPDVGPSMIHDLVEKHFVESPLDLYHLVKIYKISEFAEMMGEGYGTKSIKNFFDNINKSRNRSFDKVLLGLSIGGIGKQNAKMLAEKFQSYEKLANATEEDLQSLEGIGPKLSNTIFNWFRNPWNQDVQEILVQESLSTHYHSSSNTNQELPLAGYNLVFSGHSSNWDGDDVEIFLTSKGAKCGHSISKKTNFLIVGDNPGPSKVKKATDLGVEIIKEKDFLEKFSLKKKDTETKIEEIINNDIERLF